MELNLTVKDIMREKCNLSNFDYGMAASAIIIGITISENADLLGFLFITVSRVYTEWFCTQKHPLAGRGKWSDLLKLTRLW